jgi:hypothetical protein
MPTGGAKNVSTKILYAFFVFLGVNVNVYLKIS